MPKKKPRESRAQFDRRVAREHRAWIAARNERAAKLPFKLTRGSAISPGCRYVVVKWTVGKSRTRSVFTCHRTRKAAKDRLSDFRQGLATTAKYAKLLGPTGDTSRSNFAVYDLKTGKVVK